MEKRLKQNNCKFIAKDSLFIAVKGVDWKIKNADSRLPQKMQVFECGENSELNKKKMKNDGDSKKKERKKRSIIIRNCCNKIIAAACRVRIAQQHQQLRLLKLITQDSHFFFLPFFFFESEKEGVSRHSFKGFRY